MTLGEISLRARQLERVSAGSSSGERRGIGEPFSYCGNAEGQVLPPLFGQIWRRRVN